LKKYIVVFLVSAVAMASCIKAPIDIKSEDGGDLDIQYLNDYAVDLATYKIDSFVTSGTGSFAIGNHKDTSFGKVSASSYAQLQLPESNPLKSKNVLFDSLVLVLKPSGAYYGDTLLPFTMRVHRLTEKLDFADGTTKFYNPQNFTYSTTSIGTYNGRIKPKESKNITIKLSNLLGQELMQKLKNNDIDIQNQDNFINYFKGLCITGDSLVNNTLLYFQLTSSKALLKLHYHLFENFSTAQELDFTIDFAKQFNNISYHHHSTNLSSFIPFKRQLKSSTLTANKGYVSNVMGAYAKVRFPDIFKLKEVAAGVKILKAELVVPVSSTVYKYPYTLPPQLNLYATDNDNGLINLLTEVNPIVATPIPLTGNLSIDYLYGENTKYTFNITSYINYILEAGIFANAAIMIVPTSDPNKEVDRLMINNSLLTKNIQLKLIVLAL
jgi:Domain of unknown function (DUF4270)